jgi:hypothetical protein
MSEMREALEKMRDVAKSRIAMLEGGITLHNAGRRNYYLMEYRDKLKKIEEIIRRSNIRLVTRQDQKKE